MVRAQEQFGGYVEESGSYTVPQVAPVVTHENWGGPPPTPQYDADTKPVVSLHVPHETTADVVETPVQQIAAALGEFARMQLAQDELDAERLGPYGERPYIFDRRYLPLAQQRMLLSSLLTGLLLAEGVTVENGNDIFTEAAIFLELSGTENAASDKEFELV